MLSIGGIHEAFVPVGYREIEHDPSRGETQPWHSHDLAYISLMEHITIFLIMARVILPVPDSLGRIPYMAERIDPGAILGKAHRTATTLLYIIEL